MVSEIKQTCIFSKINTIRLHLQRKHIDSAICWTTQKEVKQFIFFDNFEHSITYQTWTLSRSRTYLVGEGVILVGDQQDGGKKRQISTPVSAFSAIVGVSLKCVL